MSQDATLRLALSLHTNPGVYALLLGSGISRSASIPTGWDIVLDLTRRVATVEGQSPDPDPETWYRSRFGEEPDYAKLLDRLTTTPAERMTLLRSYFEPDEEEREQGLKLPTPAHRAIAGFVKHGYIRVILTTNFDRLMEAALQDEGITPDVISSDDGLTGAMPYVHSQCTIVKLHGDYRDTRIRNTPEELSAYTERINGLLDRIFDDFGLIICGWSGEWDTALRAAILRSPNRRFTTFWLGRGRLGERAKELVERRRAETITIESADRFLPSLLEQLEALRELQRPSPLSTAIAVATVKRYAADPLQRVRLFDLFHEETESVYKTLHSGRFRLPNTPSVSESFFHGQVHGYEAVMERLMAMLAVLGFHDDGTNAHIFKRCIERLTGVPNLRRAFTADDLQRYPALLAIYAGGISALAGDRYDNLAAILISPTFPAREDNDNWPVLARVYAGSVFDNARAVPRGANGEQRAASDYLHDTLREVLRPYIPDDRRYTITFDIFEYVLSLTYLHIVSIDRLNSNFAPRGAFSWRYTLNPWVFSKVGGEHTPVDSFLNAAIAQRDRGALLRAGFFNGDYGKFVHAVNTHDEQVKPHQ